MDPNANLAEQDRILARHGASTLATMTVSNAARLSELRRALFAWVTDGGFRPDWRAYPVATDEYHGWASARALALRETRRARVLPWGLK